MTFSLSHFFRFPDYIQRLHPKLSKRRKKSPSEPKQMCMLPSIPMWKGSGWKITMVSFLLANPILQLSNLRKVKYASTSVRAAYRALMKWTKSKRFNRLEGRATYKKIINNKCFNLSLGCYSNTIASVNDRKTSSSTTNIWIATYSIGHLN